MKYFVSNLIVLIFATQIAWGANLAGEVTVGIRPVTAAHAVRAHAQGEPRQHIPFTLRADAEEFFRIYDAMQNPDHNPYQTFFGILFNRYYNLDRKPYPEDVTKAILIKGTKEHASYLKFSGLRRLAVSDNFNSGQQSEVYELNKTFRQRITESFRDMPTNPYYEFVIAALKLNYAETEAQIALRENAAKLVRFSISGLDDGKVKRELERYYERIREINTYSDALRYLRQYHQEVYSHRKHKDFTRFYFRVPKVLRALEWDAYKMRLFDEFNGLIVGKLHEKRKCHQKLLPDLKSIFWRALSGAMGGLAYSAVPTLKDATSLMATGYSWMTNSTGFIANGTYNGTFYNATETLNHHQQLDFSFDSQKATSAAIAASCGAVVSVVGGSLYNWFFCPSAFRLDDGDYEAEINLLSTYCTEKVVQQYRGDWGTIRSGRIADKVTDLILHDSIGFRKYIQNKLLRRKHPLPFTEILRSYGKLPSTILADYPDLRDLFTIE